MAYPGLPSGAAEKGSQEGSRRVVWSSGVTAGQSDIILPVRTTSAAGGVGTGHKAGHLSDAPGEAEARGGGASRAAKDRAANGARVDKSVQEKTT
jgi:hypothetical protein